jgi:hypothetical protein
MVKEPEISKAYYGELNKAPVIFLISTSEPFNLYVNLLTPDLDDSRKDLEMSIFDSNDQLIAHLVGNNWTKYYEKFARDWYWKGPEFDTTESAGTYKLILTNLNNQGEYAVAIGKIESFPPKVLLTLFPELIKIKTQVFHKPWYSAFNNIFGYALGGIIMTIILLILVLSKMEKKKGKK